MTSPTSPASPAAGDKEEEMPPKKRNREDQDVEEEEHPPTSPASPAAADKEEHMPPKKRNREEGEDQDVEEEEDVQEAKAAGVAFSLFGICNDPEPEPDPSCPPSSDKNSSDDDDDDYEDDDDFSADGLRARDAALSVSKSVVSIAASIDGDPPSTFACTGTVVAHQIDVRLYNKKFVKGQLLMYDLHYNIAIVSIGDEGLPRVILADLPDSYFFTPGPVVAIARKHESGRLRMKRGETIRAVSKLDCDELMVSTCQIEQNFFIGGLLMDLEKRIVGMTFIDEENTPFLPVVVVERCLKHFKAYGEIRQPWLGIRGRSLHLLESARLEEICHTFPEPSSGVFVDMIPEASSANCVGVEVGDILNELDGVILHSTAQLTSMLLDKLEVAMCERKPVILKALIQRPKDGATFDADLKVVERPHGECDTSCINRWPLPPLAEYYWGPLDISEWVDDDSD